MMKYILILLLSTHCLAVRYDGYKVHRIYTKDESQDAILLKLQEQRIDWDFWSWPNPSGQPVDVMVPPEDLIDFQEYITDNDMSIETFIEDVQALISDDHVERQPRVNITWDVYQILDNIHSWMDDLAQLYPEVTVLSAGESYEGRDLKGIKISYRDTNQSVFIEGGVHAREWISPATVTYIANELLTSTNVTVRKIAESFDWYIFPVLNPDGYAFSHSTNRLWMKNRSPQGTCTGVDLNRNFDHFWGGEGTSTNPCSDTYGGPTAFSEVETRNLDAFMKQNFPNGLDVYLSMHSYAQMLLYPYGYSDVPVDNIDDVFIIANDSANALQLLYRTRYKVGSIAETLYKVSGNSIDYFKSTLRVPIIYLYELRDLGRYGFVLPPEQIIPSGKEVMFSLATTFVEGEKLGYFNLG